MQPNTHTKQGKVQLFKQNHAVVWKPHLIVFSCGAECVESSNINHEGCNSLSIWASERICVIEIKKKERTEAISVLYKRAVLLGQLKIPHCGHIRDALR